MLIEDVACPVEKLADMTVDLGDMFQRYGYKEASCFGHALEGNLHLVFSQGFRTPEEVQRFGQLMDEMCYLVATKHSGSLKVYNPTAEICSKTDVLAIVHKQLGGAVQRLHH